MGAWRPQSIVVRLMQGPEEHYAVGAAICEAMWSPILRTHRVTLEQLAILEPGLSEMVAMAFIDTMVEAWTSASRSTASRARRPSTS
jgi:hypothetical protein